MTLLAAALLMVATFIDDAATATQPAVRMTPPPPTTTTTTTVPAWVWPWDDLARCESGGDWSINTGNGYYGGLQFTLTSWRGVGGVGYPHHATREEQIHRGELLQDVQGWGAWPACSRRLGLR
jgi:hypothetical protein